MVLPMCSQGTFPFLAPGAEQVLPDSSLEEGGEREGTRTPTLTITLYGRSAPTGARPPHHGVVWPNAQPGGHFRS